MTHERLLTTSASLVYCYPSPPLSLPCFSLLTPLIAKQHCIEEESIKISFYLFLAPGGEVGCDVSKIPCRVCGGPSSGFHFGALTCEGCKVSCFAHYVGVVSHTAIAMLLVPDVFLSPMTTIHTRLRHAPLGAQFVADCTPKKSCVPL